MIGRNFGGVNASYTVDVVVKGVSVTDATGLAPIRVSDTVIEFVMPAGVGATVDVQVRRVSPTDSLISTSAAHLVCSCRHLQHHGDKLH